MKTFLVVFIRLIGVLSVIEVLLLIETIAKEGQWIGAAAGFLIPVFVVLAVVGLMATVTVTERANKP